MKSYSAIIEKLKIDVPVKLVTTFALTLAGAIVWFLWGYIEPHFYWIDNPVTVPAYFLVINFLAGSGSLLLGWKTFKYCQKSYKDYRKDEFFEIIWIWDYLPKKKKVDHSSLQPICPQCNTQMRVSEYKKDAITVTDLLCCNIDCAVGKESDVKFMGRNESLFDQVSFKIDKRLRDKGLKT